MRGAARYGREGGERREGVGTEEGGGRRMLDFGGRERIKGILGKIRMLEHKKKDKNCSTNKL